MSGCVLRREGVHDMLVDKGRIAVSKRVIRDRFVDGFVLFSHSEPNPEARDAPGARAIGRGDLPQSPL
jgi:hypothetical protein